MLNELGEQQQGQDLERRRGWDLERRQGRDPERQQGQDLDQSQQLQVVEGLDNNLLDNYASDKIHYLIDNQSL
jgi:hypothetical protein